MTVKIKNEEIKNLEFKLLHDFSTLKEDEKINKLEFYNDFECSNFEEFIPQIESGSIIMTIDFDFGMYIKTKNKLYTSKQLKAIEAAQNLIIIGGILTCSILAFLLHDLSYLYFLITIPVGAIISNKRIFRLSFFIILFFALLFLFIANYFVFFIFIVSIINQILQFTIRNMLEDFLKENALRSELIFLCLFQIGIIKLFSPK
jgi:hypothetical protein